MTNKIVPTSTVSEETDEKMNIVKTFEDAKIELAVKTIINAEDGKTEEAKKKKRKRNRKKKTKEDNAEGEGDDEDDEEEEKKKLEEEEKKKKENKWKSFWDEELANAKLVNSRFQDNSCFRVLKNWNEKENWPQTNPPTKTIDEQFPEQIFPLGEISEYKQ